MSHELSHGLLNPMKVSSILNEDLVRVNLAGDTKEEVINNIIDLLAHSNKVKDLEKVRQAIFERERIMSTGVGKGFAIPHGKTDAVSDIVAAFAVTEKPIDYESLDHEPIRLLFLLVGKDSLVGAHIKLLSRISRLMNKEELRKRLLQAKSSSEILEILREEEMSYLDV
ncbi:MAG: PTS sugar transporter subunit IIA [Bacteroidota bacterium]|nr:PTS sugar transporter subunit IIA [Bacteroidota bacterium]